MKSNMRELQLAQVLHNIHAYGYSNTTERQEQQLYDRDLITTGRDGSVHLTPIGWEYLKQHHHKH